MSTETFGRIEVLLQTGKESITKLEFFDSGLLISGNYLIITKQEIDLKTEPDEEFNVRTINRVFKLETISGYKTYKNK